jgi:hypothetical protein
MSLSTIAYFGILICVLCCLFITFDVIRRPQKMRIMNLVWPLTALYAGPLAIWAYCKLGKHQAYNPPFWQSVLKGCLHCGSGCTLGDLISAWVLLAVPVKLFGSQLAGEWEVEYIVAFLTGVLFQYYAIKPMGKLTTGQAVIAALKADALSLTSWQLGMYGWMAISNFYLFHRQLKANDPVFWMMMEFGMLCGLVTAFPVNWWLIKRGIKEAM